MNFLAKALLLLAAPIFELILLRLFLRYGLELRLGFPGFTDYEVLFTAPLGFLAFLWALEQEKKMAIRFQSKCASLNFIFLVQFIVLNICFLDVQTHLRDVFFPIWWMNLVLVLGSSFFIWIPPRTIFNNKNFWAIIPSLVMVFSVVIYMKWGNPFWQNAIKKMGWLTQEFLTRVGDQSTKVFAGRRFLQLRNDVFVMHVGQGCSGFDGVLFFLAGFSVFSALNWKIFRAMSWFLALVSGVLLFLMLNVLRIVSLFGLASYSIQTWGYEKGQALAMGYFHAHAGYILYALGLWSYFFVLSRLRTLDMPTSPEAKKPIVKNAMINHGLPFVGTSGTPEQSTSA